MQKIKYVFLSVAIMFTESSIAQVKRLDAERIEAKSITIKKMIERHEQIVLGLTALAGMQQLCISLPALSNLCGFSFGKSAYDNSQRRFLWYHNTVNAPFFDLMQESIKLEEPSFASALSQGFKKTFFTADGWKNICAFAFSSAATSFILQKVDTKFRHPDTLRWYVYAHVPYVKAIKTIKNLTVDLQAHDLTAQERDYYYFMLYTCCDQLSGYGEDMCAYMVYKSSELEGRAAEMAEKMARYLLNYQNEALGAIGDELDKQTPDYQIIKQLIAVYESEMRSHRDMFAVIEGELQSE